MSQYASSGTALGIIISVLSASIFSNPLNPRYANMLDDENVKCVESVGESTLFIISCILGNLTLLISIPTFSALLCSIALYNRNGAVAGAGINLNAPTRALGSGK